MTKATEEQRVNDEIKYKYQALVFRTVSDLKKECDGDMKKFYDHINEAIDKAFE